PPLLYLGYIGFSVPFAFAIASLIRGRLDNAWVTTTRRWTLFSWYALTVGQMLGGQWAYEELGWGGYWGWDPVENAAFMPWLMGTAFLHSIMLQEKRNMMKVWNMTLIILTFSLSILGTFIVRSGVLNSVHAFAQSEIGPAFLVFIAAIMLVSFYLLFRRLKMLESRHTSDNLLSKETTFLLNNLLFVGIAFTVLLGTVFPLVAEAVRGTKLSIQAPFFNTIVGPMGFALLLLIGICTLVAWRHSSPAFLLRNFRVPVLVGVLAVSLLALLGMRNSGGLVAFGIAAFTGTVLIFDFYRAVRARARQQSAEVRRVKVLGGRRTVAELAAGRSYFRRAGVEHDVTKHKSAVQRVDPHVAEGAEGQVDAYVEGYQPREEVFQAALQPDSAPREVDLDIVASEVEGFLAIGEGEGALGPGGAAGRSEVQLDAEIDVREGDAIFDVVNGLILRQLPRLRTRCLCGARASSWFTTYALERKPAMRVPSYARRRPTDTVFE
ncbi:MAG: cytochrome c biogenesis protein CcsA, partial [Bacteroidetes bacterium]|nr:cytochrome c biogenesis protein CcsA [Bacteroidota bacterium]